MIFKKVLTGDEARQKLKKGIDIGVNAAKVTIGPLGRNVLIDRGIMPPGISNDGLIAINEIILEDRVENMGLDIIKGVARSTNDKARGARTASIILTQKIFEGGLEHIKEGTNVIALKRGIEKAAKEVISQLTKLAIPVTSNNDIKCIATISSESEEIGKIVADTMEKVGKDGIITVEESPITVGITSEPSTGMKIDKGWISPYMVSDYNKMTAEHTNVSVIITSDKVSMVTQFKNVLEQLGEMGKKDVLFIAEDFEGEALRTFILNKLQGGFNIIAVKAPGGFGTNKKETLNDIATLTGATVLGEDTGIALETADIEKVGFASNIIVGRDNTVIVGNPEKSEDVAKRVESLKAQKVGLKSKVEIQGMEDRISKLTGGVAVIKVGAPTDAGVKYLKAKVEDAVTESKAAMEEGIIAGGGSALVKIADGLTFDENASEEEQAGYSIIRVAIIAPFCQIVINAGKSDNDIFNEVTTKQLTQPYAGYDAVNDEVVDDMIKHGIVDAVKVIRIALENAAEGAATLLTTEVIVSDDLKENKS